VPSPFTATGFTTFRGEKIELFWHCHCEQAEGDTLLPRDVDSKKWRYKVIQGKETKEWLSDFIKRQALRDEIMFPGSSNINESINNAYTVKANKRFDFRFANHLLFYFCCQIALILLLLPQN
jgi:hypothetical protein